MHLSRLLRASAIAVVMALAPAAVRAESIVSALASAYMYNPDLMSALLSVKSSAEDIALRKAGKMPTIAATADYSGSLATSNFVGVTQNQSVSVSLAYRQTLFDNFKTDSDIEQARAYLELSTHALANAEQNLLFQVANAYMNVVRDTALVQLREANVSFFDAQVSSADERLRIGEGTRIDVSQATARRAQAVASYRSAIATLQISQATFERYVGHRPQNLRSEFPYARLLPKGLDEALRLADANHPAIKQAAAGIRVAQAGSDSAKAAFGPTLDLIGNICTINCGSGGSTGVSGTVRLSLTVPIYGGGALGAGVRKANIQQIQSEVDALSARDQIREALITAWSRMQDAAAQIESAESAVSSGQLVLDGLIQERDVGQRTTLDVLNAQAELTTAREGQIQANAARIVAAFAVIAATGRLTAPDLGLDVEIKSGEGYAAKVEDIWMELRSIDE